MTNKNLRCDEAISELRLSNESADISTEVARHLADCPECASMSESNAQVWNVWRETTPVLPNEAKWDSVWTSLSSRLNQTETAPFKPVVNTFPMRRLIAGRRRKLALAGFVLAQAAAVFMVMSIGIKEQPKTEKVGPARGDVVVEEGRTILIRKDGESVKTFELAYDDPSTTIDTNYELFNSFEAMAN